VKFSSDGHRIISGSYDKTIRVWDAAIGAEILPALGEYTGKVQSAAISPDGKRIVSGSMDAAVRIWDANTGAKISELQDTVIMFVKWTFLLMEQRLSPVHGSHHSGMGCCTSAEVLPNVRADMGSVGSGLHELPGCAICSIALSPDGTMIASGSNNAIIRLWDSATGAELLTMRGHTREVQSVMFSPDGRRINLWLIG